LIFQLVEEAVMMAIDIAEPLEAIAFLADLVREGDARFTPYAAPALKGIDAQEAHIALWNAEHSGVGSYFCVGCSIAASGGAGLCGPSGPQSVFMVGTINPASITTQNSNMAHSKMDCGLIAFQSPLGFGFIPLIIPYRA
jgi:hypothetical protein